MQHVQWSGRRASATTQGPRLRRNRRSRRLLQAARARRRLGAQVTDWGVTSVGGPARGQRAKGLVSTPASTSRIRISLDVATARPLSAGRYDEKTWQHAQGRSPTGKTLAGRRGAVSGRIRAVLNGREAEPTRSHSGGTTMSRPARKGRRQHELGGGASSALDAR